MSVLYNHIIQGDDINIISDTPSTGLHVPDTNVGELISRQAAIDAAIDAADDWDGGCSKERERFIREALEELPSVQLERDIPIKPIETTDKSWGIPNKQAVCPKCDHYLGHVSFIGDYKGKRITYCETCGQAIDWEGWDWDEED